MKELVKFEFYLPPFKGKILDDYADKNGFTRAELLRRIADEFLEKLEKTKNKP